MNTADIKQTPEYKLSKIDIIKKLYEDKNEANNVINNLSQNLANSVNKIEELNLNLTPTDCVPKGALPLELEPSVEDNTNFIEDNNKNEQIFILNQEIAELNSQIEGHFKINNELQQENEELKKENDIEKYKNENEKLKQKLCHIEATMKAFSVLLNYEVN
tara:strand:- start:769 stop:1251 length:483 start_codon:yes stop_codon:yes gene_type:complete